MTLVAVPRPSSAAGGDLATSAAARRYLMASASFQDDDGAGSVACGDDESCIFPSSASLAASSVLAGSSASPYLGQRSPAPSPRRRSNSGPYVSEGSSRVADSFDSASVCSTSTVGMSSYGNSPSPPCPSPCRSYRRSVRSASLNDDVASDLTGCSASVAVPSVAAPRNDSPVRARATNPGKEGGDEKKKGRGMGAMKSLSRSLRSRSPLLRSKGEGSDEKVKDVVDPKKDPKTSSSGRRRSRTRSPLRIVADSIKKSRRKQQHRSRSADATLSKTLDPQEEQDSDADVAAEAGRGVRLMRSLSRSRSSSRASLDPTNDGTSSVYTVSSAESYSAASPQRRFSSVCARSVASSVASVASSVAEHSERYSRLPSLIREEEPVNEERTAQQPVAEVLERTKRIPCLIERVRSHRRSRSREPEKSPSSRSSDVSEAITRIERRISESKNRAAAAPPKVLRVKMSSSAPAPAPAGLAGRMSTGQIVVRLRAGSGATDAVHHLREHQAGLSARSSERRPGSKLSYVRISGVAVPDYASYVEGAVDTFRQTLSMSDEEYKVVRAGLLGWVYYGSEI